MNPPDQLISSDDEIDLEMSSILDSVEAAQQNKKRNHEGVPVNHAVPRESIPITISSSSSPFVFGLPTSTSTPTTTAANFFSTALKERMKEIDPYNSTGIQKYLDSTDPIVKQFCDKLQFIGFVPQIPSSQEVLQIAEITCEHQLSADCKSECVSVLMSYFQNSYFIKNMENAVINKVSLVNVIAPVYQPCFSFSPAVGLETLTKIRQTCSISLQAAACENAMFIKQYLLISATQLIFKELAPKYTDKNKLREETHRHLHLIYLKAKMEYFRKFNPKSFDWNNKPNRVRHIQGKWRKENLPPPDVPINRHASKIMERIKSKKESFVPETISTEYKKFLEDGEQLVESFKRRKLQGVTTSDANSPSTATTSLQQPSTSAVLGPDSRPVPPSKEKLSHPPRPATNSKRGNGRRMGLSRKKADKTGATENRIKNNHKFPQNSSYSSLAEDIK